MNTSSHILFLNSVPLSVSRSIFFDGKNTQQIWLRYAVTTSSAFFNFSGMQKVNPVSMQIPVSA